MTTTETQEEASAIPATDLLESSSDAHEHGLEQRNHEQRNHEQRNPALHTHDHEHHDHGLALNPELTRSIDVEAPASEVDKAYSKIVRRYTRMARIPGFRAGKVPESLIRSRFAREVRQEVLESLVSERFRTAMEQGSMQPISQPQVSDLNLFEGQPLRFKATFEILPEINIDGYDSVPVQRPDTALTDDEYQAELNSVLDHHATVEPVEEERPLAVGDWAEISFKGQMKSGVETAAGESGEKKEEGGEGQSEPSENASPEIKADDVLLEVGGKNTLPAFTEALRGAKVGQEMNFEVDYPADFGDGRLAGKTVSYDLKVTAIKKKTLPERDEEFARQLGDHDSWEAFEAQLRERAEARKRDTLETQARDAMLDQLISRYEFPVPETFVQQQIDARLDRGLRALAQQGMTTEAMRQLDFNQLRAAQRSQAIAEVKASLILDRIAEREGIEITDEDLERELLMLSIQAREPIDSLRKRLAEDGSLSRLREQMRREKTGGALYDKLAA